MPDIINCPNCGAPAEGMSCAYCGTSFLSKADVLGNILGRKVTMFFEDENGHLHCCAIHVNHMTMDAGFDTVMDHSCMVRSICSGIDVDISATLEDVDYDMVKRVIGNPDSRKELSWHIR